MAQSVACKHCTLSIAFVYLYRAPTHLHGENTLLIYQVQNRTRMSTLRGISEFSFALFLVSVCFVYEPCVQAWSKEGHTMTCKIAQVDLLLPHPPHLKK